MNKIGVLEYWNIGKQRLPWSNLVARAAWNSSGMMNERAVVLLLLHYSTIPIFHSGGMQ